MNGILDLKNDIQTDTELKTMNDRTNLSDSKLNWFEPDKIYYAKDVVQILSDHGMTVSIRTVYRWAGSGLPRFLPGKSRSCVFLGEKLNTFFAQRNEPTE